MRYELFIKGCQPAAAVQPKSSIDQDDVEKFREIMQAMANMQQQQIPESIEESNTILSDQEANTLLQQLLDFQDKYFSDIPLSKDVIKLFIFNVPKPIIRTIEAFRRQPTRWPDIMNPALWLYPVLTDDPFSIVGRYWQIISEMIDDNREVIDRDAEEYMEERNNE